MTWLWFASGSSQLHRNFYSTPVNASDIYRFPTLHTSATHLLLENLGISEAFSDVLGKFQCSLDLPNENYNYVVLFLGQIYWLFIYAPKYIFSYMTIVSWNQNFLKLLKISGFLDVSSGCPSDSKNIQQHNFQCDFILQSLIYELPMVCQSNAIGRREQFLLKEMLYYHSEKSSNFIFLKISTSVDCS